MSEEPIIETPPPTAEIDHRLIMPSGDVDWGTMVPAGRLVAQLIVNEGSRHEALQMISDVCEGLGIRGEEIAHWQKQPDVSNEAEWQAWKQKAKSEEPTVAEAKAELIKRLKAHDQRLVSRLIEITKRLAQYGEELWDDENFRDGYKKVNSGLLVDARNLLKEHRIEFED